MKKLSLLLVVAAIPALSVGAAVAADLPQAAPALVYASAPASNWSGFYAGAVGTYGWGHATGSFSAPAFITDWAANQFDTNGGLLGLTLGYNFDMHNNLVLGVEGDISFGRIGGNSFLPENGLCFGAGCVPNDTWGEFHQTYFGTLRGRLGWATDTMGKPSLWYLTAGVAFTDGYRAITNETVTFSDASATHSGWVIGAGVECAIDEHWSVKGELLYADLGTAQYQHTFSPVVTDVHLTNTLFRVGVNYGF